VWSALAEASELCADAPFAPELTATKSNNTARNILFMNDPPV
jgi:hypothetical protein